MKQSDDKTREILEIYYSGKLDDESRQLVQGWLCSDENRAEKEAKIEILFFRIVRKGRKPDRYTIESLIRIQEELGFNVHTLCLGEPTPAGRRRIQLLAAAGIAAALVIVSLFVFQQRKMVAPEPEVLEQITITNDPATEQEIVLPDGSRVRMKGATTIAHEGDFTKNRRVRIDGEAYFVVTPDEHYPFTVEGRGVVITVVGTEFYMNAYEANAYAEVVLAEGKIIATSGDESVTLLPSERATIDKTRHTIHCDDISEGELLRYRGVSLSLEDVTLDEALRRIGGYYRMTMNVAQNVGPIDGIVVRLDDDATLEEALLILQAVSPVFDYTIEGNVVTVTKRY